MKTRRLFVYITGASALLILLVGLACARIVPPTERQVGPTPTPVVKPPSLAHQVTVEGNCLSCHGSDEIFLVSLQERHPVPIPPGYAGGIDGACTLCHKMDQSHNLAKPISHPIDGMGPCVSCHSGQTPGIVAAPANHSGYKVGKCTVCHTSAGQQQSSSTPSSQPAGATAGSAIPHGIGGMENCVACHGGGLPSMPPMPEAHKAFTNGACTMCHSPAQPAAK